jgi:hypothetical protein
MAIGLSTPLLGRKEGQLRSRCVNLAEPKHQCPLIQAGSASPKGQRTRPVRMTGSLGRRWILTVFDIRATLLEPVEPAI